MTICNRCSNHQH